MRQLMKHQSDALEYGKLNQHAAFFMEMRLGKTLVAIRWALHHRCERILVVAPLPVVPVWDEELRMEGESSIRRLTGTKTAKLQSPPARWSLINYEGLRTCEPLFQKDWDCVIVDESTRIRNPKAQITKMMLKYFRKARLRAVLSGMPAPESALDYFTQIAFLDDGFMSCYNYWTFRQKYFISDAMGWDWKPSSATMVEIKKKVHERAFVLTRRSTGLGSKKIYQKRIIEMTTDQMREHRRVLNDFSLKFADGQVRLTPWVVVQMQWLARVAGGFLPDGTVLSDSKVNELISLLKGELLGESVVVWFRYNDELRYVSDRLTAKGIRHRKITGETELPKRQQYIREFRDENIPVILVQLKVGKFGINLATSSTAIYYSNAYDMEDRAQSEERIINPMKADPVLYLDLITEGSVDEEVVQVLREKKVNSKFFMAELIRKWRDRRCSSALTQV